MSEAVVWEHERNAITAVSIDPLGIVVTPLTVQQTVAFATGGGGKQLLLNHNLHSAYLHNTDARFRQLYEMAPVIVIDGAPILWLAARRTARGLGPEYRLGSTDWLAALPPCKQKRLFVFGATAESNAKAVERLRSNLPKWVISGVHGYIDEADAVTRLNDFRPDLVIVGLGMPRQEHFLLTNMSELPDATYATVGGAIDYLAGATRLAPRLVGRIGMEWAWRLAHEPRRLAYRYMIEPVYLMCWISAKWLRRQIGRGSRGDAAR